MSRRSEIQSPHGDPAEPNGEPHAGVGLRLDKISKRPTHIPRKAQRAAHRRAKPTRAPRASLLAIAQSGAPPAPSRLAGFLAGSLALGRFTYGWSGVWISLLLILQFTQLGMQPALTERDRLATWTPEIEANYWEAREAFEWLEAEAVAWQDPVYRERRRRIERFGLPLSAEQSSDAAELSYAHPDPMLDRWSTSED